MMREVVSHLLTLGHRQIAIVTFPWAQDHGEIFTLGHDVSDENHVVHERVLGCRDAFEAAGVPPEGVLVCETPNDEEGGQRAVDRLLRRRHDLTALVCFSDRLAHAVVARCQALGLSVPRRMSVTGYDGIDPPGRPSDGMKLTTVRQNAFEKGRKAAEALLCAPVPAGTPIRIAAQFVAGDSSAAAWELTE
jgi:DNA-binding LacI/PurR family transcriptional regulator